ncbi:hypothetical protein C8Q80DRAFT_222146 [Daedaleopsis nitida]|nr:hypothetical protein C8Q80DRAFT_222146 [Daedaleopsis nitida]
MGLTWRIAPRCGVTVASLPLTPQGPHPLQFFLRMMNHTLFLSQCHPSIDCFSVPVGIASGPCYEIVSSLSAPHSLMPSVDHDA